MSAKVLNYQAYFHPSGAWTMDGWKDVWKDGWTDEHMGGRTSSSLSLPLPPYEGVGGEMGQSCRAQPMDDGRFKPTGGCLFWDCLTVFLVLEWREALRGAEQRLILNISWCPSNISNKVQPLRNKCLKLEP